MALRGPPPQSRVTLSRGRVSATTGRASTSPGVRPREKAESFAGYFTIFPFSTGAKAMAAFDTGDESGQAIG